MPTPKVTNKAKAKARNVKVNAGIDKNLSKKPTITLGGTDYTPATLKAEFDANSKAIDDSDAAHGNLQQAVANEKASTKKVVVLLSYLYAYVKATFGKEAVQVLSDFGFTAPKTKAQAVDKRAATRKARNTLGSRQKAQIKGQPAQANGANDGAQNEAQPQGQPQPQPQPQQGGTKQAS